MLSTKLNDGSEIPVLGLGTWKADPGLVGDAVDYAIDVGYRHFDFASIYRNEKEIGVALAKNVGSKIQRDELFITSKLWNTDHRPENVEKAVRKTLSDLRLDYLDLYLMHWGIAFMPGEEKEPKGEDGKVLVDNVSIYDTWLAMEELVKKKLVKSIGVSNFSVMMLQDLFVKAQIKPAINQIEMHPYLQHSDFLEYANYLGVKLTAYSPLTRMGLTGGRNASEDHMVIELAKKYKKTSAQILIRWAIDRGTIVIPKSTTKERIKENFEVFDFELNKEDIEKINSLDNGYRLINPIGWWGIPYFS